jgi:type IV secretion system protein TrbL
MTRRRVVSVIAAASGLGLLSTPAHAQALDDVLQNYSAASSTWLTRVQPYALGLFVALAVLELAITGVRLALHHGSSAVLGPLLKRFLLISLGWLFLSQFPLWLPRITQGFASAGQAASGSTALSPSSILDIGISLSSNMLLASAGSGFLADPTGNIVGSIVALIVLVTFALIAAQLVLVLIESYIVLSAGILFLGFAGSRLTAPLAERFFLYAIEVGIRLFFLYVLVAIGPLLPFRSPPEP